MNNKRTLLWTEKRKTESLVHLQKNDEIQRGKKESDFSDPCKLKGDKGKPSPRPCSLLK